MTADRRRVLLVSYAFPPMSIPEAVLSAKRLAGLEEHRVDVLCAEPFGEFGARDNSLDGYVARNFADVVRIEMPRWARALPLGRSELLIRTPDELRPVNPRARRALRDLDVKSYDAVITWSQWPSAHLVGLGLRRRGGPPWIAHMSDPWSNNPYLDRPRLGQWLNRRMERRVLEIADRVTVTSEEAADFILRPHGPAAREKAVVLPHAFDPVLYPGSTPPAGPTRLLYVGNFYAERTPEPLFRALAALRQREPSLLDGIRVELVGRAVPGTLDSPARRALPPGLVEIRPAVSYLESLKQMRDADVLLVIDAPSERSPFLPSKLVDYLGAERPIVAFSPPGPARRLAQRIGGWSADPTSPDAGAEALRLAIEWARRHRGESFGDRTVRAEYRNSAVARRLAQIIDGLVSQRASTLR